MTHIIQFSGGKDSTALVLWARENLPEFTAVFMDTGWEHPTTYAYIQHINEQVLGGTLVTVKNQKFPNGMTDLVRHKGMVPRSRARFCTEHLKILPFIKWRNTIDDEVTIYQGIRADESKARSEMPVRNWDDASDGYIERPLFYWTAAMCFDLMKRHGIEPNSLYLAGSARVGCFPCIMAAHGEWRRLSKTMPEVWDRALALEDAANAGRADGKCSGAHGEYASFFRPGFIPDRFCTGRGLNHADSATTATTYPTVADVRKYLTEIDDKQGALFDACPIDGCLSVYNLCE